MKTVFLILCLILITATQTHNTKSDCKGVHVHGKFHKKVVIGKGLNRPYQLIDLGDVIYFSYNVGDNSEDTFNIGHINTTGPFTQPTPLEEVVNGFSLAVNKDHTKIYFGGSEGIYEKHLSAKYSNLTKIVDGQNIWDMFYKHELYFINYPYHRLHKYDSEKKTHELVDEFKEKLLYFAMDKDDDTFIVNATGLYIIKNGTTDRIKYHGETVFRGVELNKEGDAYFCGQHGIYVPHKSNHTLIKIADIKNIFGLTFDAEEHIIYSDPHEIVKLIPEDCKK